MNTKTKSPQALWLTSAFVIQMGLTLNAQSPSADSFDPHASAGSPTTAVACLAVQPDGKIIVGGSFSQIGGLGRTNIARLNPNGTADTNFHPAVLGGILCEVDCLAVQTNGQILVGGKFSSLGDVGRKNLGRLNSDGTVDRTFNPITDSATVRALAIQADGKILLTGDFFLIGAQLLGYIARLNADGTLDANFNPDPAGKVSYVVPQADGKILLGGGFTQLGGQNCTNIGRLNPDGKLDSSFNPAVSGTCRPRAVQPDGKILVDGAFSVSGGPTNHIARLNPDGSVDPSFAMVPDGISSASITLQADGKIVLGGGFTTLWGQSRKYIGRLNANGTLDTNFTAQTDSNVRALAIQSDGKILVGGAFSVLAGSNRSCIGRLGNTNSLAFQRLIFDNPNLIWTRGGSSPEIWLATFEYCPDGVSWLPLGSGNWTSPQSPGDPGSWVLAGVAPPPNAILRARGFTAGGDYNGSSGLVETVSLPNLAISSPFRDSNGQFSFNQTGPAGLSVIVESSADLRTWIPVRTNTLGANPQQFADLAPAVNPQRFYRLHSTQ